MRRRWCAAARGSRRARPGSVARRAGRVTSRRSCPSVQPADPRPQAACAPQACSQQRRQEPVEPIAALRSLAHSFGLVASAPEAGDEVAPLATNGTGHERADRQLLPPLHLTFAVAIAGLAAAALIWAICVFMLMPLPRPRRPADALRDLDEWDKRRAGPTSPAWASRFSTPARGDMRGGDAAAARG